MDIVCCTSKLLAVPLSLLMVHLPSTHRHGNRSADLVVSVAMPKNFSPSTPTTGSHGDDRTDVEIVPPCIKAVKFWSAQFFSEMHCLTRWFWW